MCTKLSSQNKKRRSNLIILFVMLFPAARLRTHISSLITFLAASTLCSRCRNQIAYVCVFMCALALHNVSCQGCQVLVKIEQAADNVELVRTLEDSSKVLAELNTRVGGVEGVDKVVDELREQIDDTSEVTRILSEGIGAAAQVDDGEVEEEFEALLQEEMEVKMKENEALERKLRKDKEGEVNGGLTAVTGSMEELRLKGDIPAPTPTPPVPVKEKEQVPAS